ncbi:porin [Methylobacterium sp. E-016]|jgi:hypothetical protein|uniref:porin n=1 Tax=unclassified Methylobacterium TaxID=2615210 RepID=UPI0011CA0B5A|nr:MULTISPECIES: porin [unclassified Methylobacterium]MCJ2077794.1 porin [Methylobacterium sp. E-016]TXM95210.1 hypothetical protein FV223_01555 [Methylobacterium sp. WL116]
MREQGRPAAGQGVVGRSHRIAGVILIAAIGLSPCEAREWEKAPPKATSQPCPGYGSGFVRAPGSATCMRLSGRVRAGADLSAGREVAVAPMAAGRFAIDTRTESDLGPVRTFVRIGNGRP